MSHWKVCNDCNSKAGVLDTPVKFNVPLRQQKLQNDLERVTRLYETATSDLLRLEQQYELLKENFETLAAHKVRIELSTLDTAKSRKK